MGLLTWTDYLMIKEYNLWLISISVYPPMFSVLATFQSCSNVECWTLQCNVGLLEKGTSAIFQVRSRMWGETFNMVSFRKDVQKQICSHYCIKPYL